MMAEQNIKRHHDCRMWGCVSNRSGGDKELELLH